MRYRSQSTTLPSTQYTETDFDTGSVTTSANPVVVDSESHIWDIKDGGSKATKPCTHVSYFAEMFSQNRWNTSLPRTSNPALPRIRIDGLLSPIYGQTFRPSSLLSAAESYVSVTPNTTNDIGNCVFNAYNKFVTGVTALEGAVSLAEIGETPALFSIWQRRLSAPANIVNGFLNYSFGWRPVLSDLRAIARELRSFPKTVRKRLKAIGDGEVVRHFKFQLDNTVDDLNATYAAGSDGPYYWNQYSRGHSTLSKSRIVVVTIRANVKPKLGPDGQEILNKLGALGLVPSLATLWSVTRLSFVVDWFYNIGGAIENLQGSLTHDISNVRVCVSDLRVRKVQQVIEGLGGTPVPCARFTQRYYSRSQATVPILPSFTYPRRAMPYVLLSAIGLATTQTGRSILSKGPKLNVDLNLDALRRRLARGDIRLR